jgi:hypothetical protein
LTIEFKQPPDFFTLDSLTRRGKAPKSLKLWVLNKVIAGRCRWAVSDSQRDLLEARSVEELKAELKQLRKELTEAVWSGRF